VLLRNAMSTFVYGVETLDPLSYLGVRLPSRRHGQRLHVSSASSITARPRRGTESAVTTVYFPPNL
jgi:hypothetical protein